MHTHNYNSSVRLGFYVSVIYTCTEFLLSLCLPDIESEPSRAQLVYHLLIMSVVWTHNIKRLLLYICTCIDTIRAFDFNFNGGN